MLAISLFALAPLVWAGFASAAGEGPGVVKVSWPPFSADAGFAPKSLSRTELEPVRMSLEGEITHSTDLVPRR
ncbi:MAG TPA: hypothetical protein VEB65_02370 [Solirubrobacterales bacterium]|nr:hypothetical protein [Solirubrobacterales bacterium]